MIIYKSAEGKVMARFLRYLVLFIVLLSSCTSIEDVLDENVWRTLSISYDPFSDTTCYYMKSAGEEYHLDLELLVHVYLGMDGEIVDARLYSKSGNIPCSIASGDFAVRIGTAGKDEFGRPYGVLGKSGISLLSSCDPSLPLYAIYQDGNVREVTDGEKKSFSHLMSLLPDRLALEE